MPSKPSLYIGLMSGTSLDGVDAVLVDFEAAADSGLKVLGHQYSGFPDSLRSELLALNASGPDELRRAAIAANALASCYAGAVSSLLQEAGVPANAVVAAGAHGQTVRHRPGDFDGIGFTTQLNNPALLAELCGIDVIADFRSRDVAAGGQGAPLVPAFHRAVFGVAGRDRAVLNLGGIGNLTLMHADGDTGGFDCGPANALMDHWTDHHLHQSYDKDGSWASTGYPDAALLCAMMSEPFFTLPPPKSTGRDLFNPDWLATRLAAVSSAASLRAQDVQATLLELTARSATEALRRHMPQTSELLVCGGGALNAALMQRIAALLPGTAVAPTDLYGLPAMHVEAAAFAWLAKAFVDRRPGNLSQVTGAKGPRVLGALYPR
jgi:anhydro-N-acetylmuramic acid kinase